MRAAEKIKSPLDDTPSSRASAMFSARVSVLSRRVIYNAYGRPFHAAL
jgi:hypothetical protein